MANSTVLRLERRIQAEHQEALAALEQAYGQLAEALLVAARNNGYLGTEPLGALSHLLRPRIEDHQLGGAVRELWINFFNSFRPDEQAFEAKEFLDRASKLNQTLHELGTEEDLNSDLAIQMLQTLSEFWPERQHALSERIDLLINNLKEEQQARGSSDLNSAHASDEIRNTSTVLMATMAALGLNSADEDPLHKKLEILLRHYRDILAQLRDHHQDSKKHYDLFRQSLKTAAAGEWDKGKGEGLVKDERRIVDAVASLLKDVEDLENDHANLREELAQMQAEKVHLENGIKERDQRLAQYEFGANEENEDERLELYRQIMAAGDQGKDATDLIERVRSLERVFVLNNEQQQHIHKLLDRQLETIAKSLSDMRQLIGLIDDTKKYRPRLLGSSPYKLKTLAGVLQALRDAGRDAMVYIEKLRWAEGVKQLNREFRGWKKVFKEMVKLVKAIRDEEGAISVSSTISVDLSSGIAALPILLSRDVDSILRGRGANKYAQNLLEIFDEVVSAFHSGLEKSSGESIPRVEAPKRESAKSAVRRLNDELLQLASYMEEHFSDAAENGYELSAEEARLLELDTELVLLARAVDDGCEIIIGIDNAPQAEFTKLPTGKGRNVDRLREAMRERITWLEDVARYRIEEPEF